MESPDSSASLIWEYENNLSEEAGLEVEYNRINSTYRLEHRSKGNWGCRKRGRYEKEMEIILRKRVSIHAQMMEAGVHILSISDSIQT
jgi:hypothetical protein